MTALQFAQAVFNQGQDQISFFQGPRIRFPDIRTRIAGFPIQRIFHGCIDLPQGQVLFPQKPVPPGGPKDREPTTSGSNPLLQEMLFGLGGSQDGRFLVGGFFSVHGASLCIFLLA
jgi:hypothetical protein